MLLLTFPSLLSLKQLASCYDTFVYSVGLIHKVIGCGGQLDLRVGTALPDVDLATFSCLCGYVFDCAILSNEHIRTRIERRWCHMLKTVCWGKFSELVWWTLCAVIWGQSLRNSVLFIDFLEVADYCSWANWIQIPHNWKFAEEVSYQ